MAVLVEAISVVIRRARIEEIWPGGWDGFVKDCPNQTLCADDELARVGFMTPPDVIAYTEWLVERGLVGEGPDGMVDFVAVDQIRGPTRRCDWVRFGSVEFEGHKVAAARMNGSTLMTLLTPDVWNFEGSLSDTYTFTPVGQEEGALRLLRHENGRDVYLSLLTGKEVFMGRVRDPRPPEKSDV